MIISLQKTTIFLTFTVPIAVNRAPTYRLKSCYLFAVFLLSFLLFHSIAFSQRRSIITQWAKSYGGSDLDEPNVIVQTSDGGFAIGGRTHSTNGHVSNAASDRQKWIVRTDSLGNILWEKSYGPPGSSILSMVQTSDGGLAACGTRMNPTAETDFWVLRTDALGNIIWERTYGGSSQDLARGIIQTSDGGFAVTGPSDSYNGDIVDRPWALPVSYDFWTLKLDASGNIQWSVTYGGSYDEDARAITQTSDGGYAITGYSGSSDGDVTDHKHNQYNMWLIKINAAGVLQWSKSYGGNGLAFGQSVQQTTDSGFIIGANATNNGIDINDYHGGTGYDAWLVKTDATGNLQWAKCYGGTSPEYFGNAVASRYGGYIFGGITSSIDGDVVDGDVDGQYWVIKTDASGNITWSKTFGGSQIDFLMQLRETRDGGIVMAGFSGSTDGDITDHIGYTDFWIVKLGHKIATRPLLDLQYCPGDSITVSDTLFGTFNSNNTFSVQLSDVNGSFLNPVTIADFPNNHSDSSFRVALPTGIASGTGYRIRVVSSSPNAVYVDNRQDITITAVPNLLPGFLGRDTTLCTANALTLQAPAGAGYQYRWQDNSTGNQYQAIVSGDYILHVSNVLGCAVADTIKVSVGPGPAITLGNDTTLCEGTQLILDATNNNASYLWQDGSTGAQFTVDRAGIYSVRVEIDGCDTTADIEIKYELAPAISLGKDTSLCVGESMLLDATYPGAQYAWSDGSQGPQMQVTRDGVYAVAVSNFCGVDRDTIIISQENCNCFVAVPSAFSPNNDRRNDVFKPVARCSVSNYELQIFNRWGQKIFASRNPAIGWDGRFGSNLQPAGTFVWTLQYKDATTGKLIQQKGIVHLIR
jgi:gliding motility-associated-like protein